MGTYGDYRGKRYIPEEKKEEFAARVFQVLNYGGMMQLNVVSMYGYEIILLKPVEADRKGEACFHYNYFEDDRWETARYDTNNASFHSGKIGGREFCDVITAVHFLYELYDEGIGYTEINGEPVEGSLYIGWLNHILGTEYTLEKRFRLWEQFERYCLGEIEYGEDCDEKEYDGRTQRFDVKDFLPSSLYWVMGGTEFTDICYIKKGMASLREEEMQPDSYPEAVYKCRCLLEKYLGDSENEEFEQFKGLSKLIKSNRKIRIELQDSDIQAIAQMSLHLPARVFVYLACEIKKKNFWNIWKKLRDSVYTDEIMTQYASKELDATRAAVIKIPVKPVKTSEFLRQNDPFVFWNTPEELKGTPNYYLSDDDRIFWWDGSDKVVLSKEMQGWLTQLAVRHEQIIVEMETESGGEGGFLKKLVSILADIEEYYKRVFAFQDMFYEFLQHEKDKRYIAAVSLLEKLAEENREEGKIIEKAKYDWDITSRNITHNTGRLAMKRYLSVMANSQLREKYFGF